jgi:hypothetical protein
MDARREVGADRGREKGTLNVIDGGTKDGFRVLALHGANGAQESPDMLRRLLRPWDIA